MNSKDLQASQKEFTTWAKANVKGVHPMRAGSPYIVDATYAKRLSEAKETA